MSKFFEATFENLLIKLERCAWKLRKLEAFIGACGLPIIMCVEFGCVEKIAVMKIYYGMSFYIYTTHV